MACYYLQTGYLIGGLGEFGRPADLRTDTKALAAVLHGILNQHGGDQYLAIQQAGMLSDVSWDLPAQEWEEVISVLLISMAIWLALSLPICCTVFSIASSD